MKNEDRKQPLGWLVSLVIAATLAACGGGGSGGGDSSDNTAPATPPATPPATASGGQADTTAPSIVSFLPDASERVLRTTELSATFSEALAADTVTPANLRLTHSGSAVAGTLTYDAASFKVRLQPQQPLSLLASYTVTAGTGLKDLAGNSLDAERSWSFRTADGSWQTPRRLDAADASSVFPDIALDADGNSVAVWSSRAGTGWFEIRTAIHSPARGWGGVSTLSTPANQHAVLPKIRLDAEGNALAVWVQSDTVPGHGASVWSARYLKGQGWQTPMLVDALATDVQEVSLAVDAAGNAFAVWAKPVGPGLFGNSDIWAARFTPPGGWQASTRVGSAANIGTFDQAAQPQVALDGAGNAYVLWIQTASDSPVWFARYLAGSGWQPAVSVGAARLGEPFAPRLAVTNAGQAVALWNNFVSAGGALRFDLWSSVLSSADGTWSTPALLENDDAGDASHQALVADSAGNFHAVWVQFASTFRSSIRHRQYTAASGWGAVTTISSADGDFDQNRSPALVPDRNGNLMALWSVYASGFGGAQEGTYARRFAAGEGWQPTVRVDAPASGLIEMTSLAVSSDGSVAATWMQRKEFSADGPVWVNFLK